MSAEHEQDGTSSPQVMLTVAAVARRLGVAPSTLRTWDRRYGLGPSAHTSGSHRRYGQDDVSRLVVMRGLVMQGVPPAEAAQIALGPPDPGGTPAAGSTTSATTSGSSSGATSGSELGEAPWAGGRSEPPSSALPFPPSALRSSTPAQATASSSGRPAQVVPASRAAAEGDPARFGRSVWPANPWAAEHLRQSVQGDGGPDAGYDRGVGRALSTGVVGDASLEASLSRVLDGALGHLPPMASDGPLEALGAAAGWVAATTGRPGGGRVVSLPDASPRARGLARAAMALDTAEVGRLMRDAVAAYGVVNTWDTMVLPVLRGLGERWQTTGEGVDVEHAFAESTMSVLRGVSAGLQRPRNVRPVLLACADGDYHSLPLHVLSAALAEVGVGCRLLGVGMPGRSLVAATRRTGPAAVFVYARMPVGDAGVLREFPRQRPAPRVLVGGPGWQYVEVPSGVVQVDSLALAVDELRSAVHV